MVIFVRNSKFWLDYIPDARKCLFGQQETPRPQCMILVHVTLAHNDVARTAEEI